MARKRIELNADNQRRRNSLRAQQEPAAKRALLAGGRRKRCRSSPDCIIDAGDAVILLHGRERVRGDHNELRQAATVRAQPKAENGSAPAAAAQPYEPVTEPEHLEKPQRQPDREVLPLTELPRPFDVAVLADQSILLSCASNASTSVWTDRTCPILVNDRADRRPPLARMLVSIFAPIAGRANLTVKIEQPRRPSSAGTMMTSGASGNGAAAVPRSSRYRPGLIAPKCSVAAASDLVSIVCMGAVSVCAGSSSAIESGKR